MLQRRLIRWHLLYYARHNNHNTHYEQGGRLIIISYARCFSKTEIEMVRGHEGK